MTNPYKSPEEDTPEKNRTSRPVYSYFVAAFCALLVFVGSFVGIMMLPVAVFPAWHESVVGVILMYVIGIPPAIWVSVITFRVTLRADVNSRLCRRSKHLL